MSDLKKSYQKVLSNLKTGTLLICVSKTKSASLIEELYHLGQRDFGENKVQELTEKTLELVHLKEIRWHFIGHLQSNKINQLLSIKNLFSIHSIDRMSLLTKVLAKEPSDHIQLFLQVNTSGEEEKGGFEDASELETAVGLIQKSSKFNFQGFMTIGKIRTENFELDARASFEKLVKLKEKFPDAELSMGMSSDYLIAMEYGSNWVRVGSKIFGERS